MSNHPNLQPLERLFHNKTSFQLTDAQYESKTGNRLPKNRYYLLRRSALARLAEKNGFEIAMQEKTVFLTKKEEAK